MRATAGRRSTGALKRGERDASTDDLYRITDAIIAGRLAVPIAATVPIEQIRYAVTLQRGRYVHDKVVVTR